MSTKYGSVNPRTRWTWHGYPRMTDHAVDRWGQRTPVHSVSPETAFERSVDVSEIRENLTDRGGQTPERVHYFYEPSEEGSYAAVFLVRDGVIVTIYDRSSIKHGPTRAYLHAHNGHFSEVSE